jgi:hypothetical protein
MTAGRFAFFLVLIGLAAVAPAQTGVLHVPIDQTRSANEAMERADEAVRQFNRNMARHTQGAREILGKAGHYNRNVPFSLPAVVRLTMNGRSIGDGSSGGRSPDNSIDLFFDTTGPRAFPQQYRTLLQNVFNTARPTIDAVFAKPSWSGTVRVSNYDADIGDREAVAGGYFVFNNGAGQPEIRFPVYSSPEAAAVNFVHTLLLAYMGPHSYGFDAWQEGLARAATMRIVRTPGALPAGLDMELVEQVLENVYDVSSFYDWNNQRALGGARFIAPNLRDAQLPAGGSLGGIYLLRYQMAGTAWFKVLVEHPGFIAAYNRAFYAQPTAGGNVPALASMGHNVLNQLGLGNTVEGRLFGEWMRRQFILAPENTYGQKLIVHPIPITTELAGSDFGVFLVQVTYFESMLNGNENLLSGTSYPIFWDHTFNRVFPSAQEDRMDIFAAYGSVVPNLPNLANGQPYRATVDIPVQDQIARAYLPAGAVATAANPVENNLYGTVVGLSGLAGSTARVRVSSGATIFADVPVVNGAFGTRITHAGYQGNARLLVEVIERVGGIDNTVLSRRVNKGPGPIALDLRIGGDTIFNFASLPRGINLIGFPLDPWVATPEQAMSIPSGQVLAARYSQARAAYDLYPQMEPFKQGNAYFVRLNEARNGLNVAGRTSPRTPIAVALRPGWNMIANPLNHTVATARVRVIRASDFPKTFAEAVGNDIGADFFTFVRGNVDSASGAVETGTLTGATTFEPGKGYFVRVLAPEGVTLLFEPPSGQGIAGFPSDGRSPASVGASGWQMRARLIDGPLSSDIIFGQTRSATRGYDRREDSGLPQGIGGLQMYVQGPERMYRDIRHLGQPDNYVLEMEGLQAGKTYRVEMTIMRGRVNRFTVYDPIAGIRRLVRPNYTYTFRAKGPTHRVDVRIPGGLR